MANNKYRLTKKEKAHYWFLFIFLPLFGLIMGGSAIYVTFSGVYAFSLPVLIYFLFGVGGAIFLGWCVSRLVKEYKHWISLEKEDKAKTEEEAKKDVE